MIAFALLCVGLAATWVTRDIAIRVIASYEKTRPLPAPRGVITPDIPGHVQAIAFSYEDVHAQQAVMGRAHELFTELGDWEKVARVLQRESE